MTRSEHWPQRNLVLRTPRLELRPDDDQGLLELVDVIYGGVHPVEEMPFLGPWTDADPRYLGRGSLQHFWSQRAELSPERWSLHFLIRRDGHVIGVQSLTGIDFGITREVRTGSWLGLPYQRQGVGSEMRAAVLQFAFDHLGAVQARSKAFADNVASRKVSDRLGYRPDGTATVVRRDRPAQLIRLLLDRDHFVHPNWTVEVDGAEACLSLLGAA